MIDNELNEEIKTNIDVDQLERQLDKLFIDSSDWECKKILVAFVLLSSNPFWQFSLK